MDVTYRIVKPNGKEAKNLRPDKDYSVKTKSVKTKVVGNLVKHTIIEITLELTDEG